MSVGQKEKKKKVNEMNENVQTNALKNVPGIEFIEHLAKYKSIEHNGIMRVVGLYA